MNAVSHRNYQMGGSVFIRQYQDRLVVESPGGFPNGITIENILDRQSPRNRRIAEILALCGLVERSGQGMNLMYEWSIKEAKQLPDFTGTDQDFVKLTLNGMVLDEKMLSLINRIGDERMESLTTGDFLVINAMYHAESIPQNLRQNLKRLENLGLVEHIGRNRYVLVRSLYAAVGKSGVHTRIVGLDRETNKELLLKHIRESGEYGTPFKELQQVLPGKAGISYRFSCVNFGRKIAYIVREKTAVQNGLQMILVRVHIIKYDWNATWVSFRSHSKAFLFIPITVVWF